MDHELNPYEIEDLSITSASLKVSDDKNIATISCGDKVLFKGTLIEGKVLQAVLNQILDDPVYGGYKAMVIGETNG